MDEENVWLEKTDDDLIEHAIWEHQHLAYLQRMVAHGQRELKKALDEIEKRQLKSPFGAAE